MARSTAAVSVEKYGLPVPRGEDDGAPLLEMSNGAAADVRLRQLLHADGRHDARVDALPLEHVLHGQRVDHRAEHAHVVGGDAVHAGLARAASRARCCRRRSPVRRDAPVSTTATISSANRLTARSRTRIPCSPARASPESFSRTRGYFRALAHRWRSVIPGRAGSGRTAAPDVLARLRRHLLHEIADRLLRLAHPRLVHERDVLVERLDLSLDDLVDHVLGLALACTCSRRCGARTRPCPAGT